MMKAGDRVIVRPTTLQGKWEPEWVAGRHGEFLGTNRIGYARVHIDGDCPQSIGGVALVHPESLQPET